MEKPFLLYFAVPQSSDEPPLPPYNPAVQGREKVLSDSAVTERRMGGTTNYTTRKQVFTGWEDWDG